MLAEVFLQAALHFLSTEVPAWERQNHCYSCHNNGDAALADTTAWLHQPSRGAA
jgi:hypothetical protein